MPISCDLPYCHRNTKLSGRHLYPLPRSTLLMLTYAFVGRDLSLDAYRQAIDHVYGFGDCMIVV